jgi:hypothetical protein
VVLETLLLVVVELVVELLGMPRSAASQLSSVLVDSALLEELDSSSLGSESEALSLALALSLSDSNVAEVDLVLLNKVNTTLLELEPESEFEVTTADVVVLSEIPNHPNKLKAEELDEDDG